MSNANDAIRRLTEATLRCLGCGEFNRPGVQPLIRIDDQNIAHCDVCSHHWPVGTTVTKEPT